MILLVVAASGNNDAGISYSGRIPPVDVVRSYVDPALAQHNDDRVSGTPASACHCFHYRNVGQKRAHLRGDVTRGSICTCERELRILILRSI